MSGQLVGSLNVHDHPCSVYSNSEELKRGFVPYLQAGLMLGERCLYFYNENSAEFVTQAMRLNDFDVQHYIDKKALLIIDTADAHLKDDHFGEAKMLDYWSQCIKEAKLAGFQSMRAAVEMTWALSGLPGCEILAPYEARLNQFTDNFPVSVICQYHRRKFSPAKIKAVINAHPLVVIDDQVYQNPSCIEHERYDDSDLDLDVQATLDNLALIRKLQISNTALESRNQECELLYEEIRNLARSVSHELQEPLNIITSYMRLLAVRYSGKLGTDADEFIERSVGSAQIVSQMIDDLWTYARIDAPGDSELHLVDGNVALGGALERMRVLITENRAQITHDSLLSVFCFDKHLTFLFEEMITNAIQHSGLKDPKVHIGARRRNNANVFTVKSEGKALDLTDSSAVFRVFSRLNKRPDNTGTGMGLAICKRIIEYHGGKLWYESDGTSTTFCFSLPSEQQVLSNSKVMDIRSFVQNKSARNKPQT